MRQNMKFIIWVLLIASCLSQGKINNPKPADTNKTVGNLGTFLPEYLAQVKKSQKSKDPSRYFPMNTEYVYGYHGVDKFFMPLYSVEYVCLDNNYTFCEFSYAYNHKDILIGKYFYKKSNKGIQIIGSQFPPENKVNTFNNFIFLPFPLKKNILGARIFYEQHL